MIYGSRPSGQLAQSALWLTAERSLDKYPRAYEIVNNDIYVDDCVSGSADEALGLKDTDELQLSIADGGFNWKGFTFSGRDPDPSWVVVRCLWELGVESGIQKQTE